MSDGIHDSPINISGGQMREAKRQLRVQRVVGRTDTQLLDALQNLPHRIDIIYKRGLPKSDSVPSLRDQINRFLDAEVGAANDKVSGQSGRGEASDSQ